MSSAGFHRHLESPELRIHFPNGLDMGVEQLTRGYAANDPDLPLLKLRSFGVVRVFADEEVLAPDFIARVVAGKQAARPWADVLNTGLAIQPAGDPLATRRR